MKLKNFANNLAADFYRLVRMKSLYIGLGIMLLLVILYSVAQYALARLIESGELGMEGEIAAATGVTQSFGILMLNGAASSTGAFFLSVIVAALFIGADFGCGTMRLYVGRGVSKTSIYLSKFVCIFTVTAVYVLVSYLMCVIAALAVGVSPGTIKEYSATTAECLGIYLVIALVMSSIYTCVCFLVRSKAGGLGILLAMYVLLGSVLTTIIQLSLGMTINAETPANYFCMFLNPYFTTDSLARLDLLTTKELACALGGSLFWTLAFGALGIVCNNKRDVK